MAERQQGRLGERLARLRDSDGYLYALLVIVWCGATVALQQGLGLRWWVWVASGALYLLLFEVGLATVLAAAWSSIPGLQAEGGSKTEGDGGGG